MSEAHEYNTLEKMSHAVAKQMVTLAEKAIIERGRFTLALSGGSTPRMLYRLLATDYASAFDWENVHVFWGDERCVSPESDESCYKMAKDTLLDHVAIPVENIHRMHGEIDPQAAASQYNMLLSELFTGLPRFDLILLGMGADGHTASLFPDTAALKVSNRWVVENFVEKLHMWRITMTYPTLNAARHVYVLLAGTDKAEVYQHVRANAQPPYPIQGVQPSAGEVVWWRSV